MARKTTFKENYIKTYYSQDYIWDSLNKVKVRRITSLVDTLALLGKDLLVVIAPGKVTFYPEYIPDHLKGVISTTNYEAFVHLVKEDQFQLIDFNAWFVNQKTKSEYSLYPKTGIHWSRYAMDLVIDSLLSYIENKRNIDIPDYIIGQPVLSEKLIDPNRDLEDDMNLLFDIPNQPMAYSDVSYDEVGKENPTSIVISDSFFWGLYRKGLRKLAFNNEEFWFYNREIYTPGGDSPGQVSEVDVYSEIMKTDIIILMITDANLPKFPRGFDQSATYALDNPDEYLGNLRKREEKIKGYIDPIKSSAYWLETIRLKALEKNILLDSMHRMDAIYMVENE